MGFMYLFVGQNPETFNLLPHHSGSLSESEIFRLPIAWLL